MIPILRMGNKGTNKPELSVFYSGENHQNGEFVGSE